MEQVVVKHRVTLKLKAVELFGDLVHFPEQHMLLLNMPETEDQHADSEVLTIVLRDSECVAQAASAAGVDLQHVVTIKDYSEHVGLADSLVEVGAIRRLSECTTGPFGSPVVIGEVIR